MASSVDHQEAISAMKSTPLSLATPLMHSIHLQTSQLILSRPYDQCHALVNKLNGIEVDSDVASQLSATWWAPRQEMPPKVWCTGRKPVSTIIFFQLKPAISQAAKQHYGYARVQFSTIIDQSLSWQGSRQEMALWSVVADPWQGMLAPP